MPLNLNRRSDDETLSQQIIYPGLVIYDNKTEVSVNLLQNVPGVSGDDNINNSIEALEYELTKAIPPDYPGGEKIGGFSYGAR